MHRVVNMRHAPRRVFCVVSGWAWGHRALRSVRADLAVDGLHAAVPPAPVVRAGAPRGAAVALRQGRATCLERSLVLQQLLAQRGAPHPVIVGVRSPAAALARHGATAHAWIDGHDPDESATFAEIRRIPPPGVPTHAR